MKETTVLNQISRIIDNINYRSVYIEIQTEHDKYILEKDKHSRIGFKSRQIK